MTHWRPMVSGWMPGVHAEAATRSGEWRVVAHHQRQALGSQALQSLVEALDAGCELWCHVLAEHGEVVEDDEHGFGGLDDPPACGQVLEATVGVLELLGGVPNLHGGHGDGAPKLASLIGGAADHVDDELELPPLGRQDPVVLLVDE